MLFLGDSIPVFTQVASRIQLFVVAGPRLSFLAGLTRRVIPSF